MGIFDKFKRKAEEPKEEEISLEGIQSNQKKLDQASSEFLQCFGPSFTNTPEGHIATDIAGASSIAGLMILRSVGIDLSKHEPGTVILAEEINIKQGPVFNYVAAIGHNMGVNPQEKLSEGALEEHKPRFKTEELSKMLEKSFYRACEKHKVPSLYYPIAAALTAMKLVGAGKDMGMLDPKIGLHLVMYNVVAGSKTIPHPI